MNRTLSAALTIMFLFMTGCPGFGTEELTGELVENPEWDKDVKPLMATYCDECHGPTASNGAPPYFRTDTCEDGEVLGAASTSALSLSRVLNEGFPMPPTYFAAQMSDEEKQTLKNWVDQGSKCAQ